VSLVLGASVALVAGTTAAGSAVASADPTPALSPGATQPSVVVAPASTNPTCEPSTYVDVAAGFTYQAFTKLGICDFAVPSGITAIDYVVIAGGGSGGVGRGGGGGAGGMLVSSTNVTAGSSLTLDVGDGGPANSGVNPPGVAGQDSILTGPGLGTITAQGGGGGGTWAGPDPSGNPSTNGQGTPGGPGGSGGGASGGDVSAREPDLIGGTGIAGQGNNGGRSSVPSVNACTGSNVGINSICAAGGGGGAGGVGLSGGRIAGVDDTFGGAGGPGLSVNWIDSTVARNLQIGDDSGGVPYFAGGGGGGVKQRADVNNVEGIAGAGGVGGGGAGSNTTGAPAASGVPGTGGGGGGNEGGAGPAGKGGSGIIVLRYASAVIPQCNPSVVVIGADTIVTFAGVGVCAWTPPAGLDQIDFLLVGGGGGGGAAGGGGGGGGSLAEDTAIDISSAAGPLRITPGFGGLPGGLSTDGSVGAASTLQIGSTTYSAPGGLGGRSGLINNSGGVGGSGADATAPGGAGGNGPSTSASAGSPGGAGPSSSISGSAIVYGGGGGGGISTPNDGTTTVAAARKGPVSGGNRGGGAGPLGSWDSSNPGGSGLAGSGGGGGGGQTGGPYDGAGGRGGSGVVILRYTQIAPVAPVISATPGNGTASIAWSVSNIGGSALTSVEFALDDTSTVYFTTTTVTSPTQLSGLTNGQTYTVYARVVNSVGTGPWSLPTQVTPIAPPVPAGPPISVRAVAGDASANVSWSPPATAGSFPVTSYRVTAQPGGRGCLVAAPTVRCTVTGLTNGVTYTFTVAALTGAGWSPDALSNPVTPGGVTPNPEPVPVPEPLTPGQSVLLVDGVPDSSVRVEPKARDNGLTITGDDWSMDLDGLGPDGRPLNLGPNGALILNQQREVRTTGRGFMPRSDVDLFIDPPVLVQGSTVDRVRAVSTEAVYVGTVRTTAQGTFDGVVTLPADIAPGEHVLQVVGLSPSGETRAMNLGVIVEPWIVLARGTRTPQGLHDRIRTTGSSAGVEAGTRLTPWIRFSGQRSFTQGKATIRVQSDGSFTWTRQIRKDRALTAYVSWTDVESNRVTWKKVR
jgi:hypothetical protein